MDGCGIHQFQEERERLNAIVSRYSNRTMKRFMGLDLEAYDGGALPPRTKEMLGLVASTVLRCDDCIRYHLLRCHAAGVDDAEMAEILSIALLVGGSITIPHLRRAYEAWDELRTAPAEGAD